MKPIRTIFLAVLALATAAPALGDEPVPPRLVIPVPDAERGREIFADKGCVVCHAVNGIGGKAGPALDTGRYDGEIVPLDFAARMWRGAGAMATLQALNFGYQIELSGEDIANLAAFVSDDDERAKFTEDDVPEVFRGWTINAAVGTLSGAGDDGAPGTPEERRLVSITRGYVLAERNCAECHAVLREGEYGVLGPAFAEIARTPDTTADTIRARLSQPHEKMPEFLELTEADIDDLAAYILSMRR